MLVRASGILSLVGKIAQKLRDSTAVVRHRTKLRRLPKYRPDSEAGVDVLLNFPGEPINMYQIRQWYGPLEHLAKTHSVAILCYQPATAECVTQETDLKVVLTPTYTDLREVEDVLRPKVILYPNQNYANYRILGLTESEHIFICHGESDKIYMASNWLKVFNYFFVAGEASRDRLRKHLLNYDVDARTMAIGRPQIDIRHDSPLEEIHEKTTVLYAPTWEGGRRSMRYGSVASHGIDIVQSLLKDDQYRVIYRPHPRTGVHDIDFVKADRRIRALIANANDEGNQCHYIDETPFSWQLDFADAMITDVSAVAYDWLMTAKPLIITQPTELEAVMPAEGFIPEIPLLTASEASDTANILSALLSDGYQKKLLSTWADYYYGDRTPGSSLARFVNAIETVVEERTRYAKAPDVASNACLTITAGNANQPVSARSSFQNSAVQGATFLRRSFAFATAGIANLAAQSRADSQILDTIYSAMAKRPAEILVSTMAGPHDIDSIIEWLPSLEVLNRTHPLALLAGNPRSYERLRKLTSLRVYIGRSASETEEVFAALRPLLHLQFEQTNLNLRELTHRNMLHAYIGTDVDDRWINNRLRAFDVVVAATIEQSEMVKNTLIDFPELSTVTTIPEDGNSEDNRVLTLVGLLPT